MDTPRRQELTEIKDFLNRHRAAGRRQTVHYVERGKTAIGLVSSSGNVVRKTYLTKRTSITPTPTVKVSHVLENRRSSVFLNRRFSSLSDDKLLRALPMTSRSLIRVASEPGTYRRGSVSIRSSSFSRGTKRRTSSVYGISEEEGDKVLSCARSNA